MALPKQDDQAKAGAPEWVVTFGDMMCLLMCFFVLLLSFSTMESEKFKVVAGYIRQAFGVQVENRFTNVPAGQSIISQNFEPSSSSSAAAVQLGKARKMVEQLDLDAFVKVDLAAEAVRVTLKGSFAYEPGSSQLRPEARELVARAGDLVLEWGARVVVGGHTDSSPLQSADYASNWELSAERATVVVREFLERGVPGTRLEATAFADTRPVADNITLEGRRRNRRVEIMIYPE